MHSKSSQPAPRQHRRSDEAPRPPVESAPDGLKHVGPVAQEIFGQPPSWLVRWGITVLSVLIALAVAATWVIEYPERLEARSIITVGGPPVSVVARAQGQLRLLVENDQTVESDTPLAVIGGNASWEAVRAVQAQLDTLQAALQRGDSVLNFEWDVTREVGELRQSYDALNRVVKRHNEHMQSTYYRDAIENLRNQLPLSQRLTEQHEEIRRILDRESQISLQRYEVNRSLAEDQLISRLETFGSEQSYLEQQRARLNAELELISLALQHEQRNRALLDLLNVARLEKDARVLEVEQAFTQLTAQADDWEARHVLRAPVEGVVSLLVLWSEEHFIGMGQEVLVLIPGLEEKALLARMRLPVHGAGKVHVGQNVLIRLDSYPYAEFGAVRGVVTALSSIPQEEVFVVEATLPHGLTTTYGHRIPLQTNLTGVAGIITKPQRLLERILSQIKLTTDRVR